MKHDARLADYLEGLLPPDDAAAVEREVAHDANLAARLQALQAVLSEPVTLPPIATPAGLAERVAARAQLAPPDGRLADRLEGLLGDGDAAALDLTVSSDPEVGARLRALDTLLAPPVRLPPIAPPEDLLERTLARLAEEGLWVDEEAADAPALAPPAGLLDATLERLEAEGLVASPPAIGAATAEPVGAVVPFPSHGLRRFGALAAAALLSAALGLLAGRGLAPAGGGDSAAVAALRETIARAREAERAAAGRSSSLAAELATSRQRARDAAEAAEAARRDLTAARRSLAAREADLARGEQAAERLSLLEQQLAALRERLATREAALAAAREAAAEAEALAQRVQEGEELLAANRAAVLRLEAALADAERRAELLAAASPAPREGLAIRAAQDVERWDPDVGEWVPLEGVTALPAGTVVRGRGGASALTAEARRYALRQGAFVVSAGGRIEPLPASGRSWQAAAEQRYASAEQHSVPELIEALTSGSPRARARAEHALIALFHRLPDGRSGPLPSSTRDWEVWWDRVGPTLTAYAPR